MKSRELGIDGRFDRRAVEMLALELTMLAKAHGLNVARVEITTLKRTARAPRARVGGNSTGRGLRSNARGSGRAGT
jgi:hypothetical protein